MRTGFDGLDLLLLILCVAAIGWCMRDGVEHHREITRRHHPDYETSRYNPRTRKGAERDD